MQFQVTIDEALRPGIAAARAARNASLPQTVQDGEVQDGFEDDGATPRMVPNMVPNPDLITADEAYMVWVNVQAAKSYYTQFVGTPPAPSPAPAPGGGGGQVTEVVRRKGIQALINRGKLALVQPAIDAVKAQNAILGATFQNEFDNSQTFQRDRPSLIALAAAIGITDLDEWFQYASTL